MLSPDVLLSSQNPVRLLCLDRNFGLAKRFYTNELDHDALTTSTTVQTLNTQRETPRQKRRITLTCWMGGSVSSGYDMQASFVTIMRVASLVLTMHGSPKMLTSCKNQRFPIQNNCVGRKNKTTGICIHAGCSCRPDAEANPNLCTRWCRRSSCFFKIVPGSGSLIHHQCSRDAYHYAG